jgi:CspA family cold shock protein
VQRVQVELIKAAKLFMLMRLFFQPGSINGLTENPKEGRWRKMPRGRVKWFNEQKGFGFISQDGGEDLFVHFSSIKQDGFKVLHEGDEVTFEIAQGKKGLQAVDVVKA